MICLGGVTSTFYNQDTSANGSSGTRTLDLPVMSRMLWPTELKTQNLNLTGFFPNPKEAGLREETTWYLSTSSSLMRSAGLEPARNKFRGILSPLRLPISPWPLRPLLLKAGKIREDYGIMMDADNRTWTCTVSYQNLNLTRLPFRHIRLFFWKFLFVYLI